MDIKRAVEYLDLLEDGDPELAHSEAEELLLDYLRHNGAGELAKAFVNARYRIGFFYA